MSACRSADHQGEGGSCSDISGKPRKAAKCWLSIGKISMLRPETASKASGHPCPVRSRARISGKTALKVIASSIRKGNVIEQDGKLYVVLTAENIHPGKGTPVSQIEMRRISDGVKISERYKTTDQVEKATIEDRNFNYLYEDADGFHFMNSETYDQVQVPKDVVGPVRALPAGKHDGQALDARRRRRWRSSCRSARRWKWWKPSRSPRARPHRPPTSPPSCPTASVPRCRRTSPPGTRIVVMTEDGSYVERAKD